MELKGKVVYLGTTIQVTESFKKREVVLEITESNLQYPQEVKFEGIKDFCDKMDDLVPGTELTAYFNINGRKWTNKDNVDQWFNTLQMWKFDVNKSVEVVNEPESQDLPF